MVAVCFSICFQSCRFSACTVLNVCCCFSFPFSFCLSVLTTRLLCAIFWHFVIKILSSQRQILSSQHQILSSQRQILSSQRQILSSQCQILSSQHQILSSQRQILSSQRQILSSQHLMICLQLLNYATTTLLFSDKHVDSAIISWNRVVLLHGEDCHSESNADIKCFCLCVCAQLLQHECVYASMLCVCIQSCIISVCVFSCFICVCVCVSVCVCVCVCESMFMHDVCVCNILTMCVTDCENISEMPLHFAACIGILIFVLYVIVLTQGVCLPGFAFAGNFQYFTGKDQHLPQISNWSDVLAVILLDQFFFFFFFFPKQQHTVQTK